MSNNVVVLGKAGTNNNYIPFSLSDGGVLYTDQAPNSNAGIIQGYDIATSGGQDFGIVMDGFGAGINALPTCSLLYATNTTSGAIEPVGINDAGQLIVSGGGGGGGGTVQIQDSNGNPLLGTADALNVNIQGVDLIDVGTEIGLAVNVLNFPATQPVSVAGSVAVTGSFYQATQPVSGSVSVSNFPASQPISGSVSVSNFPATQPVSGSVDANITNTNLDVTISNFPATQPVSGSVSVSNFPASQLVSGSVDANIINTSLDVNVGNFPTTQAVSGTVAVSNTSFEVSNFPATQPVSGSVSVSNFPTTQPVSGTVAVSNTSFEVSNFPTTQPVSGTVAVSNTSFEVSNFPTTQPVSGNVSVSNFPTTQPVSGTVAVSNTSFEVSNFPATQPVSGTVAVSNTSFEVSNFPATQPVSGNVSVSGSVSVSNFPATQPVSGSVSVSNFPTTQPVSGTVAVSNTSFEVSNFPTTQPVSGSVSVSNFPTTQPVSGTVAVSNTSFEVSNFPATQPVSVAGSVAVTGSFYQATQPVSGSVSVSNFPATQPVSGTVSVNTITGYALDTTVTTSNIFLDNIENSLTGLTYTGGNLNVNVASGSISVGSVNIKDSTGNNLNSTSGALNSYITNTSLDTHLHAFHSGSWVDVASASNGHLLVNSSTQDGAGTSITSTLNGAKQSLDVNVANMTAIPVSGTFYQATQPISGAVSLTDGTDTAEITPINSNLTTTNKGLICNSVLYGLNVASSQTQPISLLYNIEANRNQLSVTDFEATILLNDITNIEADIRSNTASLMSFASASNASLSSIDGKATTTNSSLSSIDGKATTTNSSLSTINGKLSTTTYNTLTGLNVYNIYPAKLSYVWSGFQAIASNNNFVFGGNSLITSFNIGINYLRNFYIYHNGTGNKYVDVDYIDSVGNLQSIVGLVITTSTTLVRVSNAINIIKIVWSVIGGSVDNTATTFICRDNVDTAINRNAIATQINQPIMTVPFGYKGIIKNFSIYLALAGDVRLIVRDINNNTKMSKYYANASNAQVMLSPYNNGQYGNAFYPLDLELDGGDSCFMQNVNSGSGNTIFNGIVEIIKL